MKTDVLILGSVTDAEKLPLDWHGEVRTILHELPSRLAQISKLKIEINDNNSFQIGLNDIRKSLRTAVAIRAFARSLKFDVRLIILIGKHDSQTSEHLGNPDSRLSIRIYRDDYDAEFQLLTDFADHLISSWTAVQCKVMFSKLTSGSNHTAIGQALGVSRQMVSKTLKTCGENLIDTYLARFEKLVNQNSFSNYKYWGKYTEESSRRYQDKMLELCPGTPDIDLLKGDLRGEPQANHLMFKLPPLHWLENPDIWYEFLIGYDVMEPHVGIYYGVKCVSQSESDFNKAIDESEKHLADIQQELHVVLNNVFIHKDFTQRFKKTNNAQNKTYWPFWITLYEEEDIRKVGLVALNIIRGVYENYLLRLKSTHNLKPLKAIDYSSECETRFTEEAYRNLQRALEQSNASNASKDKSNQCSDSDRAYAREVIRLIEKAKQKGWLKMAEIPGADFGLIFSFPGAKDSEFTYFWMALPQRAFNMFSKGILRPCWDAASYVFLKRNGTLWTGNKLKSTFDANYTYMVDRWKTRIRELDADEI